MIWYLKIFLKRMRTKEVSSHKTRERNNSQALIYYFLKRQTWLESKSKNGIVCIRQKCALEHFYVTHQFQMQSTYSLLLIITVRRNLNIALISAKIIFACWNVISGSHSYDHQFLLVFASLCACFVIIAYSRLSPA